MIERAPDRKSSRLSTARDARTIGINGFRPQLVFLVAFAIAYFFFWYMSFGLLICSVIATAAALTSRCSVALSGDSAVVSWRIFAVPIRKRPLDLTRFERSAASEQLDFIGLALYSLVAVLLIFVLMAIGLAILPVILIFLLMFPLRIVLPSVGKLPGRLNEVVDQMLLVVETFGVGQSVYQIDLKSTDRKTTLCSRLTRRQAGQVSAALGKTGSLKVSGLTPE